MRSKSLFAAAMVFFIPALAFAGQKKSATVQLDQPVKVADTQLTPGEYKLTWDGDGPNVTVSFLAGKKTVATAPAHLVSDPTSQPGTIETNTASDKTVILQAVGLKNQTMQFDNAVRTAGN
jgi:hypothetical protein